MWEYKLLYSIVLVVRVAQNKWCNNKNWNMYIYLFIFLFFALFCIVCYLGIIFWEKELFKTFIRLYKPMKYGALCIDTVQVCQSFKRLSKNFLLSNCCNQLNVTKTVKTEDNLKKKELGHNYLMWWWNFSILWMC